MAYRRTMRGVYSPLNYPLPSNSLPLLPAAVAAVKAAAKIAVAQNGGGMAGAYGPAARRWPGAYSRRGMATLSGATARPGMGATFDPMSWIKENPGMAAGVGIAAAVLLFGMGGRRGRR